MAASPAAAEDMVVLDEREDQPWESMGSVDFNARLRVYRKPSSYPSFAAWVQFGMNLHNNSNYKRVVHHEHRRRFLDGSGTEFYNEVDSEVREFTLAPREWRTVWFGLRHGFGKHYLMATEGTLIRNGQRSAGVSRAEWLSPHDSWHMG